MKLDHSIVFTFENITFSAAVVANFTQEDWVKWASDRYFMKDKKEVKAKKLTEVYQACQKLMAPSAAAADAQPAPEVADAVPAEPAKAEAKPAKKP